MLFSDKIHLACGGIAQLGERLNGIQEVSGSIPLISTKGYAKRLVFVRKQAFSLFCDEIGISVPSQPLPKGAFRVDAPLFVSQVGTDFADPLS